MDDLNSAITKEMATIRQTELEHSGHYEEAYLSFADSSIDRVQDVFVDKLGRVILPAKPEYEQLKSIAFREVDGEGRVTREVVDKEPRYEGSRRSSLVVYLTVTEETDELD